MKETKDALYILLDLLDSIDKSSKNNSFIKIEEFKLNKIRDEIFDLITLSDNNDKNIEKKIELIGILPSALIDPRKFPTIESLNKFAERSLNSQIPFWNKRNRTEIIGRIIAEIDTKKGEDFDLFFNAWKDFVKDDKSKKYEPGKKDYVNIWLDFFDHYREDK
jgi:hypothetical protein